MLTVVKGRLRRSRKARSLPSNRLRSVLPHTHLLLRLVQQRSEHTDPCKTCRHRRRRRRSHMYVFAVPTINRRTSLTPRTDLLTPTVYWPMVESSLGIVGACLPLLRPIFTDTRAKNIFSSLRTLLSRPSSRSSSARTESLEYAKMEAGGTGTPQTPQTPHKFKEALMV